jgi:hypothetical protein
MRSENCAWMDEDEIGTGAHGKKWRKSGNGGLTQHWRASFFDGSDFSRWHLQLKQRPPINDECTVLPCKSQDNWQNSQPESHKP